MKEVPTREGTILNWGGSKAVLLNTCLLQTANLNLRN